MALICLIANFWNSCRLNLVCAGIRHPQNLEECGIRHPQNLEECNFHDYCVWFEVFWNCCFDPEFIFKLYCEPAVNSSAFKTCFRPNQVPPQMIVRWPFEIQRATQVRLSCGDPEVMHCGHPTPSWGESRPQILAWPMITLILFSKRKNSN